MDVVRMDDGSTDRGVERMNDGSTDRGVEGIDQMIEVL